MMKNFSKIADLLIDVEETVRKNVELDDYFSEKILSGDLFKDYKGNMVVGDMVKYALNKIAVNHKENFSLNHKIPFVVEIYYMIESIFKQARIKVEKKDLEKMANTLAYYYDGKGDSELESSLLEKYDIEDEVWEDLVEEVIEQCNEYESELKNMSIKRNKRRPYTNFSNFDYSEGKFEDDIDVPVRYKNVIKNPRYDE